MIFVFGSNLEGRHGKGSALAAKQKYGAKQGVAYGPTGDSFAIPTCGLPGKPLRLDIISGYVARFIEYAKQHPELSFKVVAIGCGSAGYLPEHVAPMFFTAPKNCDLPIEFRNILDKGNP